MARCFTLYVLVVSRVSDCFVSNILEEDPKLSEELDGVFQMNWNGFSSPILPEFSALVFDLLFPWSCLVLVDFLWYFSFPFAHF